MDGILNIKRLVLHVFLCILTFSCTNKEKINQDIIADNFLEITDTTAYKLGSFRPLPPEPNSTPKYLDENIILLVEVTPRVTTDNRLEDDLKAFFEEEGIESSFKQLYLEKPYLHFSIDASFPDTIGRYKISLSDQDDFTDIRYAGKITIRNFKRKDGIAFFIVEKTEGRSTIAYIVLLKQLKGIWKVVNREFLYET